MKCIINASTCLHNQDGQCLDQPMPKDLGCLGTVCFNIVTRRKEVERIEMGPRRFGPDRPNLHHSKAT